MEQTRVDSRTEHALVDLKAEQQATLARPRVDYTALARFFFASMNPVAGKRTTLAKAKLLEILAGVPYRAWENRAYGRMTRGYRKVDLVNEAGRVVQYSREAQDNEYQHLLVLHEKMAEDGVHDPRYLARPIPVMMVTAYGLLARTLARFRLHRAYLFNAEFEDHAEHEYAQFVADHPEMEHQPVRSRLAREWAGVETWADVFRRISLDERNHMNASLLFAGRAKEVVVYPGMPPAPGTGTRSVPAGGAR